jgi:hypothetical protein
MADRPVKCTDHPIIHYIMVMECAYKDIPISNWKESGLELTSQRLEVPKLWYKLCDDVLESIFVYISHLIPSNFYIYPSIPTL